MRQSGLIAAMQERNRKMQPSAASNDSMQDIEFQCQQRSVLTCIRDPHYMSSIPFRPCGGAQARSVAEATSMALRSANERQAAPRSAHQMRMDRADALRVEVLSKYYYFTIFILIEKYAVVNQSCMEFCWC